MTSPKSFTIFLAVVFALLSMGVLALRRGPFGRVLVAMKDSEAACATLGLSLRTTKLVVFMLSAAMAGVGGALYGAASSVATGTRLRDVREPARPGRRGHRRRLGLLSGALAGGLALGFFPANAEDVFIGAGTIILAFYSDGLLPLIYSRFGRWWHGLSAPGPTPSPWRRAIAAGHSPGPGRLRHKAGSKEPPGTLGRRPPPRAPHTPPRRGHAVPPRGWRSGTQPLHCNSCPVRLRPARQAPAPGDHIFSLREVARAHNRPARP